VLPLCCFAVLPFNPTLQHHNTKDDTFPLANENFDIRTSDFLTYFG